MADFAWPRLQPGQAGAASVPSANGVRLHPQDQQQQRWCVFLQVCCNSCVRVRSSHARGALCIALSAELMGCSAHDAGRWGCGLWCVWDLSDCAAACSAYLLSEPIWQCKRNWRCASTARVALVCVCVCLLWQTLTISVCEVATGLLLLAAGNLCSPGAVVDAPGCRFVWAIVCAGKCLLCRLETV